MRLIKRKQAAREGLRRFYTGQPCAQGHDAERYVANGVCVQCQRQRRRSEHREIQELRREAAKRNGSQ